MRLLIFWVTSAPDPLSRERGGGIIYRFIVSVLPDFDTEYDFKATVVGPLTTLPVTE
jgi:hypothetical protein